MLEKERMTVYIVLISLYYVLPSAPTPLHTNHQVSPYNKASICSRAKSRAVREILNKVFYPAYDKYSNIMVGKSTCSLGKARDIFYHQETEGKVKEHSARWICNYCGKRFISEDFLDQHFDGKHYDYLPKASDNPICLADYCETLRCERRTYQVADLHWQEALCDEVRMREMHTSCLQLVSQCIPAHTKSRNKDANLTDIMCSHLACDRYWADDPKPTASWRIALYIILSICVVVGVSFYYIVVYMYMYSEEDRNTYGALDPSHNIIYPPTHYKEHLRHRYDTRPKI